MEGQGGREVMKVTFPQAAERVLTEAKEPLHYREITRRALAAELVDTDGRTPEISINAQICTHMNRAGDKSRFVRVVPGVFGLRQWVSEGQVQAVEDEGRIFTPHFPVYSGLRAVMPVWAGLKAAAISSMRHQVWLLRGNPQETEDWSNPDEWIRQRLSGEPQKVALATWEGSGKRMNPRYTTGEWSLARAYRLLTETQSGLLEISSRGRNFLDHPEGEVVREIDLSQGLAKILELVAELGTASRADLLGPWRQQVEAESRVRSDAVVKSLLWARLRNLVDRGLVEKAGHSYAPTPSGLEYLRMVGAPTSTGEPDLAQQVRQLADQQRRTVRDELVETLSEMDPYAFEHLVKRLLDEMGYENVSVTRQSNDKGVDVVGDIEVGITSVREVIQVKRHRANVQRRVLDELRGVLFRFQAVRGTIITTGDFSKGTRDAAFERGAPPITLIDGNRLLDLLVEHGLGVKKRMLELWELDTQILLASDEEEETTEE